MAYYIIYDDYIFAHKYLIIIIEFYSANICITYYAIILWYKKYNAIIWPPIMMLYIQFRDWSCQQDEKIYYKCIYDIFRWEDGNNLTSNLFTLITPLTTHKNTSGIHVCSYKPYIEKKNNEKKNNNIKKMREKYKNCAICTLTKRIKCKKLQLYVCTDKSRYISNIYNKQIKEGKISTCMYKHLSFILIYN